MFKLNLFLISIPDVLKESKIAGYQFLGLGGEPSFCLILNPYSEDHVNIQFREMGLNRSHWQMVMAPCHKMVHDFAVYRKTIEQYDEYILELDDIKSKLQIPEQFKQFVIDNPYGLTKRLGAFSFTTEAWRQSIFDMADRYNFEFAVLDMQSKEEQSQALATIAESFHQSILHKNFANILAKSHGQCAEIRNFLVSTNQVKQP